jgi:sulfonate transport system substrate-binding protein
LLLKALADAGLKSSDIELFKTKGSDVPTLLEQKSVDAGITWDPHVSNALASGHSRVLLKAEKIMPIKAGHYIGNGEYAREDFIAANPELVQALVEANVKAIRYIIKDPKGAAKLWSEQIGFPIKVIDYSLSQGISVYNEDIVPEKSTIDAYTKFLKDAGILKPEDNPKVDASFAEKAMTAM